MATDFLKTSLNLPMSLQIFQKFLITHDGFRLAFDEGSQVFLVLAKGQANGIVDEIGQGALSMGRLDAKSSDARSELKYIVERFTGSLMVITSMSKDSAVTSRRQDVRMSGFLRR